jgi:hypothetical protein
VAAAREGYRRRFPTRAVIAVVSPTLAESLGQACRRWRSQVSQGFGDRSNGGSSFLVPSLPILPPVVIGPVPWRFIVKRHAAGAVKQRRHDRARRPLCCSAPTC